MDEKYENLPIYQQMEGKFLKKADIVKNFPSNFGINNSGVQFEYATTSGTTSDRMQIIRKPNWWIDEYERTYSNHAKLKKYFDENIHKIIFTTAQCSNLVCFLERPPMKQRIINNTLYVNNTFNPWDWTEENIREISDEINYFKPYYMDADPVYLGIFLYLRKKYHIEAPLHTPEIITLSYEFVPSNMRKYIEKYFNTEVRNLYGTTEFGYAFLENAEGKMQICPDLLEVKLHPVEAEKNLYSLIISSTKNEYMPLINYYVGDMVIATKDEVETFADAGVVTKMAGREKDLLWNQLSVSMLDDVVAGGSSNVMLYQFYFISDNLCHFNYLTFNGEELSGEEKEGIKSKMLEYRPELNLTFHHVSDITPEVSGKFSIIKRII